ncbi:MAG: hypothetical protein ACRDT6_23010 [Micromonosporaceae bacterium]
MAYDLTELKQHASALHTHALALTQAGRPYEGLAMIATAVRIADQIVTAADTAANRTTWSRALRTKSQVLRHLGRCAEAVWVMEEAALAIWPLTRATGATERRPYVAELADCELAMGSQLRELADLWHDQQMLIRAARHYGNAIRLWGELFDRAATPDSAQALERALTVQAAVLDQLGCRCGGPTCQAHHPPVTGAGRSAGLASHYSGRHRGHPER